MTVQTRRRKPRVRLKEPASLNFLSGARGVIVDISESGVRFKASAPLKDERSKFRFAFSGGGELSADLKWMDESRTTGGLSFTSLSPELRKQTRTWVAQSWERPRKSGFAGPTDALSADRPIANSAPVFFTEIQGLAQAVREKPKSALGNFGGNPGNQTGPENRLSMFSREASPVMHKTVVSAHKHALGRVLAMVVLVLVIFLVAATAAAEYFDPSGTRHLMGRAEEIAIHATIRTRNLILPKSNAQRSGATAQNGD